MEEADATKPLCHHCARAHFVVLIAGQNLPVLTELVLIQDCSLIANIVNGFVLSS